MRILFLFVLAVIACTGLWGCSNDEASQILFPDMSSGSTTLRIVRATNPRLPQLSPEQFHALLIETGKVAKRHFGVDLQFEAAIVALRERSKSAILQERFV